MSNFDETYIDLVINMDEIDPALVIQNPHLVISKLSDFRFKTPGILNYSLIDFILEHKQDFPVKEDLLISYLSFREEKTVEFLCNYLCNGKRIDLLLEELKKKSYNLLVSDVLKHDGDGSYAVKNIIKTLISIKNGPDLIHFYNQKNVITEFLLKNKNIIERYFQLFPDSNKFINFLQQFQVKNISHIDDMTIIKNEKMIDCFNAIFINNLMEINPYNLGVISKCYFKKDVIDSSDFINFEIEKVKNYYLINIEKTITAVIESRLEIADDQKTINFILRNNAISIDVRNIYSQHLKKNTIENIIDLDDELYLVIVEGELYRYNYNNLSYLYEKKKIDIDRLVHFVLDNFDEIKGKIENKNMLIALINHKELPVNRVLKMVEITDQTIDLSEINDDEKMSVLIKSNKVIVDENNFILCKGKRLSVFACLEKNLDLSSKLSSFYSINEFEDLFLDKSLSAKVKAYVANENFNIFKASISKTSVEQILIAIKRYKQKNYSKDFLLWLITLGTEDDRNYLLKTYNKMLEMNN